MGIFFAGLASGVALTIGVLYLGYILVGIREDSYPEKRSY